MDKAWRLLGMSSVYSMWVNKMMESRKEAQSLRKLLSYSKKKEKKDREKEMLMRILNHITFHKSLIDDSDDDDYARFGRYQQLIDQLDGGTHLAIKNMYDRSLALIFEPSRLGMAIVIRMARITRMMRSSRSVRPRCRFTVLPGSPSVPGKPPL